MVMAEGLRGTISRRALLMEQSQVIFPFIFLYKFCCFVVI